MKRLLKNIPIIEILIELDYKRNDIAATDLIKHPDSIKKSRRLNDLKLQILNSIAMSAVVSIKGQGLEIVKQKQSKKDYTYYIQFRVTYEDGSTFDTAIIFRIGNHPMKGDETDIDSGSVIIRDFVVKGKRYDNSASIIQTIGNICVELKKGNIKILDEFTYDRR